MSNRHSTLFRSVCVECHRPIRSTQSLFPGNISEISINFIWPRTLTSVFYLLLYWKASYSFSMTHARFIQLLVTRHPFQISSRKERNTNVITSILFLELLRKSTLLVRYKLNILRPPRVNHFDNSALLFGGYGSFISLDKMVLYMVYLYLSSGSWSMLFNCFR